MQQLCFYVLRILVVDVADAKRNKQMTRTMIALRKMMMFVWKMHNPKTPLNCKRNYNKSKNKPKACINQLDFKYMIKILPIMLESNMLQIMDLDK